MLSTPEQLFFLHRKEFLKCFEPNFDVSLLCGKAIKRKENWEIQQIRKSKTSSVNNSGENNLVLKETRKAAELELLLTTFKQDLIKKYGIPERP